LLYVSQEKHCTITLLSNTKKARKQLIMILGKIIEEEMKSMLATQ
jgi:hypothetical protein